MTNPATIHIIIIIEMKKYTELKHNQRTYWENKALDLVRNESQFKGSVGYSVMQADMDISVLAELLYNIFCEGVNEAHEQRRRSYKELKR